VTLAALVASVVLGTASLAWGYMVVGLPQLARWLIAFGILWLVAVSRRWRWFAHVGLAVYFLAAALGLWFMDFPPGWMFAGAILAMLAWDLTFFQYRQRFAASDDERRGVERRHLLRVSVLCILGFVAASLAMMLRLQLTLEWIAFMVVVVALGVSQIIRWFQQRS